MHVVKATINKLFQRDHPYTYVDIEHTQYSMHCKIMSAALCMLTKCFFNWPKLTFKKIWTSVNICYFFILGLQSTCLSIHTDYLQMLYITVNGYDKMFATEIPVFVINVCPTMNEQDVPDMISCECITGIDTPCVHIEHECFI